MSVVYIEDGEPIEHALKRFKKECQKSGLPAELRKREHYEKPSVTRKRKMEAAKRKQRRRMMKLMGKLENM